jgi:hypothetical protein
MGSQVGYGHSDDAGAQPFDYYKIQNASALTSTIQMLSSQLILDGATQVTSGALTIDLPLNPVDGAVAEITSISGVTSGNTLVVQVASTDQVAAATGTSGIKGLAAPTALSAGVAIKYRFTWFGDILTQSPANVPPGVQQSQTAAQVGTNPSLALPQGASVGTNAGYWIRIA